MKHGKLDRQALSATQMQQIEKAIREDILHTNRYNEIRFSGNAQARDTGYDVSGTLELVGQKRDLAFYAVRGASGISAKLGLTPSLWGISPYKAMLGAIRLQDRMSVEFELTL